MKKNVYLLAILGSLTLLGCDEKEGGDTFDFGQTYTFEYVDNTPVVGAEVVVKSKAFIDETIATGTTNEKGEVYFTQEELENSPYTMPYNLIIYAKKDYYSNIEDLAIHSSYNGEVNQNMKFLVKLSFTEGLLEPSKWNYAKSYVNGDDITSMVSDCSKDNYIDITTGIDANNNNTLIIQNMDGALTCTESDYYYLNTTFAALRLVNPTLESGTTIPSGQTDQLASSTSTVINPAIEIKNDTLFVASSGQGGEYVTAYTPEF